jgi:hypothetical protein
MMASKPISTLLKELDDGQKKAVMNLLKRLQDGAIINDKDVGLLGTDLKAATGAFCYRFFGISKQALQNWIIDGCPRNPDGTYNLSSVHEWRLVRERRKADKDTGSKKEEKMQKEIELMVAKINKINAETMPIQDHNTKMVSLANSVKIQIGIWCRRFAHKCVGLTAEEAPIVLDIGCRELAESIADGVCDK